MNRKLIVFSFPFYFPGQREDKQQKKENFQKNVFLSKIYFEKLCIKHGEKAISYLSI